MKIGETVASDLAALREEMRKFLIEAVARGNVISTVDAHRRLQLKFARSLGVAEVAAIFDANRPGRPKVAARSGRKAPRKDDRGTGPEFVVLAPGGTPVLARDRREAIETITALVSAGTDASLVEVFRRVPMQISRSFDVGLDRP